MSSLLKRAREHALSIMAGVFVSASLLFGAHAAQAQTLSIDDPIIVEGNAGTTTMTFTVTLTDENNADFTVDWATSDVTADDGTDYGAGSGTLMFAGSAGETKTINITINGDTTIEPDETFDITLSNVVLGIAADPTTITKATGVGTIQNDDAAAAPVPTLTEWAMILLGLVLAGFAALTLHRRRVI